MEVILITIDAKFIHTNLAVRSLKVNSTYPVTIKEFTIKDSNESIISFILNEKPKIIGFSVYIWNIEKIKKIIPKIKENYNPYIIFGGPETSYDIEHWFNTLDIDFIIRGEGEKSFNLLINSLINKLNYKNIENLSYKLNDQLINNRSSEISDLSQLKLPYTLEEDKTNLKNKIQYIETSRGCPYKCSYCMASLEKSVRFFPIDKVKESIIYLIEEGAKTFKFLDRTFNANMKYAIEIFDFIIKNHQKGNVFQFEITGDILDERIINYLNTNAPKDLFRFEIGIQSTNTLTNELVDRIQNNDKLFNNIKLIQDSNIIDLHLDLIAGLPLEDITSFEKTFNEVYSLRPKELQLGFLKMLRGTKIRQEASKYKYIFDKNAPYQIQENSVLTKNDLYDVHLVEHILNIYHNSNFMPKTLKLLFDLVDNPFDFMNNLGHFWVNNNYMFHKYQLDEVFNRLYNYLEYIKADYSNDILDTLKFDYLYKHKIKPKIWWNDKLDKVTKNNVIRIFHKKNNNHRIDDLYKHSVVTKYKNGYLIVLYQNNNKYLYQL